ncbi:MAG: hypothetical protein ACPGVB_15360 [Chitinophagales bacterium]
MKPYTTDPYWGKYQDHIRFMNIRHNPISKLRAKNAFRTKKKGMRRKAKAYILKELELYTITKHTQDYEEYK